MPKFIRNKTIFAHDGHTYRFTGFMFTYVLADGNREFARCTEADANTVSGYGIAGCIAAFNDIQIMEGESTFPTRPDSYEQFLKKDEWKLKFLKSLPIGLTRTEYNDRIIEATINEMDI